MIKRILPIYHSGWFYLLLILWLTGYSLIANGGFNSVNQLNINMLYSGKDSSNTQDSSIPNLESKQSNPRQTSNRETSPQVLRLQTAFTESGFVNVIDVLSHYPESSVTLIGNPSEHFLKQLETYLVINPRKNKVIISSFDGLSSEVVKIKDEIFISSVLDWLRFSSIESVTQLNSRHLLFSPAVYNQNKLLPLVWKKKDKHYLNATGEILNQFIRNNHYGVTNNKVTPRIEGLELVNYWQLYLSVKNNTNEEIWPLGFIGELFTADQLIKPLTIPHFIKEQGLEKFTFLNKNTKFPVIVINDFSDYGLQTSATASGLVQQLIHHEYLYQTLLSLMLFGLLLAIGLIAIWLVQSFSFSKQLMVLAVYSASLFVIQYMLFTEQQWLAVVPIITMLAGTWLLLFAYHKERSLFIAAYSKSVSLQTGTVATKTTRKTLIKKTLTDSSPSANSLIESRATNTVKLTTTVKPVLEQTIVMVGTDNALDKTMVMDTIQNQPTPKANHHFQVTSFGRYQVEGVLGRGAMGIVYQGVDPRINRHVAIKTLQLNEGANEQEYSEAKTRFFREAQTAGSLSHANIVTIYDVGEEDQLGYIAMDLLTGAPLSLFVKPEQLLPAPLTYQLMAQITDALEYAHNQHVVHRDIKPDNIIYDDELQKITVTDFGIAYVSDHSKTKTGVIMGSPYYMSPEQILGKQVDRRSDIFSLGTTFYQLLCGHLPFEGESIATVAFQITQSKAIAVNQHNNNLPASALRITKKAMHKDIDKRYQTMAEFKTALISALKRDFKVTS